MNEHEKELITLAYELVNLNGGAIEVNGKYLVRFDRNTNRTELIFIK